MSMKKRKVSDIQSVIMTVLSLMTVITSISMGLLLYNRYELAMRQNEVRNTQNLMESTVNSMEQYLKNMRQISDTVTYNIIQAFDVSSPEFNQQLSFLYDFNKDKIQSIALYDMEGNLIVAEPVTLQKDGIEVLWQSWFENAAEEIENMHFSTPHMQNLFQDDAKSYHWVISLSRAVELTSNGNSTLGVLLVDMNYSSIEQLFNKANTDNSSEYVYLMDSDGEIIYHPKQKLIYTNLYEENNLEAVHYDDGSHQEIFQGEKRLITVKTVSYTGWKIVSVVPMSAFNMGLYGTRMFVIMLMALSMLMIIIINQLVSARIAKPLQRLNESVKEWEAGNLNPTIYVGGSLEVEHLGKTLRSTVEQINQLMHDILYEQEEKRKSELDALQSQINPHFLYNTLDSIVWMIEGERYEDAVFMITQLASLFRISLSRGKTIISVEDEIKHAKNYMNIQKIRYKNSFAIDFSIEEEILHCCTVKLVVQPLLENAIYYGVEGMDGEGEIHVKGYRKEDDIYIEVSDNGLGMPQDMVEQLLTDNNRVRKHGSGVGVINVHNRIRLRFGKPYGLEIESMPDEGTTIRIHLPYIPYEPEKLELLENGKMQELKGGKEQ